MFGSWEKTQKLHYIFRKDSLQSNFNLAGGKVVQSNQITASAGNKIMALNIPCNTELCHFTNVYILYTYKNKTVFLSFSTEDKRTITESYNSCI